MVNAFNVRSTDDEGETVIDYFLMVSWVGIGIEVLC